MKRKQRIIGLTVLSVMAGVLSGCGQSREELLKDKETKQMTEAVPITEKVTEAPAEDAPETESETQKLITSVDYTSKDGTIKITLPDNTWKVTQDADEMRVFSSGSAAMINIVHAGTESAMNNLSIMKTEEDLKASLTRQYSDANAYEVESFVNNTINNVNTYRYVVKYNATARMWAYAVTYGIIAENQAYVISGTVTDENKSLLSAVEKSVDSFHILKDESLKTVTTDVIPGKTQTAAGTAQNGGTAQTEANGTKEYGYDAYLYTNDHVNVRKMPGTDAEVLDTMAKGDKVKVTGESDGWFKVDINGNTGYIRKDFLVNQPVDGQTSNSADVSQAEESTGTMYGTSTTLYASDGVNIRRKPGTDSSVIGSLYAGSAVSVIGETDNWFIISVDGNNGYVSKAYLTSDSSVVNTANNGGTTDNSGTTGNTGTTDNTGNTTNGGTTDNTGTADNTGTTDNSGNNGNTGNSTGSSSSISGEVVSTGVDYVTVKGEDGSTYNVYYGDTTPNTVDGLYDGVYVEISVDNNQTSDDGTLYATGVQGY